jgi:hypothetical protein
MSYESPPAAGTPLENTGGVMSLRPLLATALGASQKGLPWLEPISLCQVDSAGGTHSVVGVVGAEPGFWGLLDSRS